MVINGNGDTKATRAREKTTRNATAMKKIDGYKHYYITEEGRVWSSYKKDYVSTYNHTTMAYPMVMLWKNNKAVKHYIHRLLAIAFIDNPDNKPLVRHLDDNPQNYSLENLAWGDKSENALDWRRR